MSLFPLRVGCVDAGTNAIRVMAAGFFDPDHYGPLYYERVPIRLGHHVFTDGLLDQTAMDRSVEAFRRFARRIEELGCQGFRAVATSAVREARNATVFRDRIYRETGIYLHVICGSEEARMVHRAVRSRVDLSGGQWILADLGGGSVEVSIVDDTGIRGIESYTMGSVRLLEIVSGVTDREEELRRLRKHVGTLRIPARMRRLKPTGLIATGGNIEELADLAAVEADARGVRRLPVAELEAWIERLAGMSYEERIERLELREDRADVIIPAALVYHRLATLSSASEIVVPGVGVKEGVLLEMVDEYVSANSPSRRG